MTTATVTDAYREQIWKIVHSIPQGKVSSYGAVAQYAGLPRGARLVGRILSQLPSGSALPWHRVVNASGRITFPLGSDKYREQRERLMSDGVILRNDKIDWKLFGWDGSHGS
ncbi:MAG: cysteine methyltransferase [Verrucomicrobiaceae bacterium]|nr:cysteine methyltransferase [Verrucomicrobiaceae bacterium]